MMKRILALLLALCLLPAMPLALAEDADDPVEEDISEEELAEIKNMDEVSDDEGGETIKVIGETYKEMNKEDFNKKSPALYTCKVLDNSGVYSERSTESKRLIKLSGKRADVLYVGSAWVIIRYEDYIGYVLRQRITDVEPVDPVNTPPYGVMKSSYIATTADVCEVRKSMSDEDESWVVLNPGTLLSIWKIQDGWAVVPYWRTYGYINLNDLGNLIPVSPTDAPLSEDTPIAAYTSYYDMNQSDINKSRIINISVACNRLSRTMQPDESFNFNKDAGPYRASNGYQKAWVLIDGESKPGYGGGTCQVSSTLYNALLQLPGVQILQRRPHGPSGAKYLPHGVDAAVGNENLNLRFRNNYDFPIRVEGHSSGDGALLMVVYKVSQ